MRWMKPICLSFFKAARAKQTRINPAFCLESLEPKVLLSAELLGGVVDGQHFDSNDLADPFAKQSVLHDWAAHVVSKVQLQSGSENMGANNISADIQLSALSAYLAEQQSQHNPDDLSQMLADVAIQATQANQQSLELIIIDPRTPDYMRLVEGVSTDSGSDYLVYMLDAEQDGIEQISALLSSHNDLNAVHLISHGSDTGIQLGSSWLSSENLASYEDQIANWQGVFTEDADILIYGCDLAGSLSGIQLIESLAELTGADVAGSEDVTGAFQQGGDWDLEYQSGEINTSVAFTTTTQNGWAYTLGPPVNGLLLLSTSGEVSSPSGAPGLDSWQESSVLSFDPDTVGFEPGTSGVFSELFDTEFFDGDSSVDGLHYVTQDISIGTGTPIDLLEGDILFSLDSDKVLFNGLLSYVPTSKEDVILFRPDSSDDYYSGNFSVLMSKSGVGDLSGFTLVEQDTVVGDTTLSAGTFIYSAKGGEADSKSIYTFTPGDLSLSPSNGSVATLVDGDEEVTVGESIFQDNIIGIEFVENDYTIAGTTLSAGTILVTTDGDKGVWLDGEELGTRHDIFSLNLTQTTLVSGSTLGSSALFFEGSDVGLDSNSENLSALSFVEVQTQSNSEPVGDVVITGTVTEDQTLTADTSGIVDDDGLGPFSYQWQRDGATISGETSSTYTLDDIDVGATISVSVSYTDGASNQEVLISANTSPVANVNDDPFVDNPNNNRTAVQDVAFSYTFPEDTFGDLDSGDTLTYSAELQSGDPLPTWLDFDGSSRTFSGTPTSGDVTTLNIALTADDGNGTPAVDYFDIQVVNTNDAPTATNLTQVKTYSEGDGGVALDDIVVSDADAGETVTATLTLNNPAAGVLTVGTFGSATSSYDTNSGEWTVTGSVVDVNAALAAVEFTPEVNNELNTTITTRIQDAAATGPADGIISLNVNPLNDAPTASNLTQVQLYTEGANSLELDDIVVSDVDAGEVISATLKLLNTSAGSLTTGTFGGAMSAYDTNTGVWTVTGSVADVNSALASVAFVPEANNDVTTRIETHIEDSFSAGPSDGLITINVAAQNDEPLATGLNQSRTYSEGDASVALNNIVVSDVDTGETITATLTLVNAEAGALTTGSFGASASTYNSTTGGWTVTGSVADVNAALADVAFTPATNFDLDTRIITHIEDSAGTFPNDGAIDLIVKSVNDDPTVERTIPNQTATEDTAYRFTVNASTFSDADTGDSLSFTAQLASGAALPSWLRFDAGTLTFSGTPANDDVGGLNVEVIADDGNGGAPAVASFALNVDNSNDAPSGEVLITGNFTTGQTLTANVSAIADDDGLGVFSYQWQKNGQSILGANQATYVLEAADVGSDLTVLVSYTDSGGTNEQLSSLPFFVPDLEGDSFTSASGRESAETLKNNFQALSASEELEELVVDEESGEESEDEVINLEASVVGSEAIAARGFAADMDIFRDQSPAFEQNSMYNDAQATNDNASALAFLASANEGTIEEKEALFRERAGSYLPYEDPLVLIQANSFIQGLDTMREDVNQTVVFNNTVVGSSLAVSAGASAGYVAWLARSGVLLSSALSSLPVWRFVDPLPVLTQTEGVLAADQESLESIIEDGSQEQSLASASDTPVDSKDLQV